MMKKFHVMPATVIFVLATLTGVNMGAVTGAIATGVGSLIWCW